MVPLEYFSNCRRTIEMPLIDGEINFILIMFYLMLLLTFVITFVITDTKFYVPVVT